MNGALAQLGERLPCTQEVAGSIPVSSTIHDSLEMSFASFNRALCWLMLVESFLLRDEKSL